MSPLKETNFFIFDGGRPDFAGPRGEILNRDIVYKLNDYKALFKNVKDEKAIGEASPRYICSPGTAYRIRSRLPQCKLVAILRNPVDRAFSSFSMYKRDGFEPCETFEEAIADEPRRIAERWAFAIHVQRGFYAHQLEEYFNVFPREQIRVYLYDDLLQHPIELLKNICRFIGVDDKYVPDVSKKHNVSGMIENPVLRFLWTKTHSVRSALPIMPKKLRQSVSQFFISRSMVKLELAEQTWCQLLDLYKEDILKLQHLIQRDLSMWYSRTGR